MELKRLFRWLFKRSKPKHKPLGDVAGFSPHRIAELDFSNTEFRDAKVYVRMSATWEQLLKFQDQSSTGIEKNDLQFFAEERLVSWNLTDEDGNLIPTTYKGLMTLPADFLLLMYNTWIATIGRVPVPLDESLSDGDQSPVESIPTEELSLNLDQFSKPVLSTPSVDGTDVSRVN